MGVSDSQPSSRSILLRDRLSTMMTSWLCRRGGHTNGSNTKNKKGEQRGDHKGDDAGSCCLDY